MRAQARRAAKACAWEYEMGRALEIRARRRTGSDQWHFADAVARACGARASAYVALRDGNVRAARACHAKSHQPVVSFA